MKAITRNTITCMKFFVLFRLTPRRRLPWIFLSKERWASILAVLCLLVPVCPASASSGNISETEKLAWSENGGWVNFRPAYGGVTVLANHLSGFAWGENIGWIKLGSDAGGGNPYYANTNATNWGVNNDGGGNLSGHAWSETAGWINFHSTHSQVTIDADGLFHGFAWNENLGWIQLSNPDAPAFGVCIARNPTMAELASFGAKSIAKGVLLKWQTGYEIDTAGFDLLRAEAGHTKYTRITNLLIPWKGGPALGATYTHADRTAALGKTYFYKLEEIDNSGKSTLYGPVSAVAGVIRLVYPEKRAVATANQSVGFQWESEAFSRFRIEFSRRSDFRSETVSLPRSMVKEHGAARTRWIDDRRYTPTATEWAEIMRLAGKHRIVYWRVVGKVKSGGLSPSVAWGIEVQ